MSRLSWNRLAVIVLAVMLAGVLIGSLIINNLGYFAPPLLPYTVYIYLLVWLPVLVIGILLRPSGRIRQAAMGLVIGGAVILIAGLVLMGSAFNHTSGTCALTPQTDQPILYTCTSAPNYQGATVTYELVGQAGSPFVKLSP